jgi:hypothetical protein
MFSCAFQDRYPKVSFPDGAVPSFSCPPRLGFPDDDVLTVRDHDLPKVTAALEVAVCLVRFREQECLVDYGVQSVHLYGAVHGLDVGAASDVTWVGDICVGDPVLGRRAFIRIGDRVLERLLVWHRDFVIGCVAFQIHKG